jgi:transcriptional regulator with XRE-family HTH domain
MIRSESEYKQTVNRYREGLEFAEREREQLRSEGFSPEEIDRGVAPTLGFLSEMEWEIDWYERMRRGDFDVVRDLSDTGRLLIGARIAKGWTQRQLASALGVTEAQVSRDERNEYHGIASTRAAAILGILGIQIFLQASQATEWRREKTVQERIQPPARELKVNVFSTSGRQAHVETAIGSSQKRVGIDTDSPVLVAA